jgi:hypothetical protein
LVIIIITLTFATRLLSQHENKELKWNFIIIIINVIITLITLFNVDSLRRNCPYTRFASAAGAISIDIGIFSGKSFLRNDLLR